MNDPFRAFQIFALWSPDAVTTKAPSGLYIAVLTPSLWPFRSAFNKPVARSQILAVSSLEAVTILLPSGLNSASLTDAVWPIGRTRTGSVASVGLLWQP